MDNIFDSLVKELFMQILANNDHQTAKNVTSANLANLNKNQNEILRCFAELSKNLKLSIKILFEFNFK